MNNTAERIGSATLLVITALYVVMAVSLPTESPNLSDLGPRIYPLLLGISATMVAAVWTVQAFRIKSKKAGGDQGGAEQGHSWLKVVSLIVVAAIFPLIVESLTFIPTATIVLFALSNIIAWRKPTLRQGVIAILFALASATGLKLLLVDVMSIYLP